MEASSAKLQVQKNHRDGGKVPRSRGRSAKPGTRSQEPEAVGVKLGTRGAVGPIHLSSAGGVTWEKPYVWETQDVSLATESPVLTVNDDLPQLEEARTPPIASFERKTDSLAGMQVGVRGQRARRRGARVAWDGEYGRGGRGVGVGRMGSTTTGGNACWRVGSDETCRSGRRAGWLIGFGNSTVDHIVPPVKNDSVLDSVNSRIWGRVEHFNYQVSASPRASLQCSVDASSTVLINSRGFVHSSYSRDTHRHHLTPSGLNSKADVKQPLMPSSWIPGWDAMVGECGREREMALGHKYGKGGRPA
ncbi:hypothetical protein JB92DRAFT_2838571 [Gautieria morchelliformis]|nr:hypothetical protein JB92DRAFT_2838571 [Gautieria morchelliformis]